MNFVSFEAVKPQEEYTFGLQEDTSDSRTKSAKVANNLLTQIPAEASGFYLFAVALFEKPLDGIIYWILFIISILLLILVRKLAKASLAVILTSVIAFAIWMFVIDGGALKEIFFGENVSENVEAFGVLFAFLYTTVVTLLANYGVLK